MFFYFFCFVFTVLFSFCLGAQWWRPSTPHYCIIIISELALYIRFIGFWSKILFKCETLRTGLWSPVVSQAIGGILAMPHPDVFGAHRFLEVKDWIVKWYLKTSMVVAGGPKIFNVQCIWGRIFVSLEKVFCF